MFRGTFTAVVTPFRNGEVDFSALEKLIESQIAAGITGIVAVGTTTVRCLEASAAAHGAPVAGDAETDLFITPGFEFRVVDRLVTNFHLPRSTLLVLVSAFAGIEPVRRAYEHAVGERYRFYSYGDAMLVDKIHR